MSVKKAAFAGIRWKMLATFLVAGLGVLQLYLLVRLIDKRDFGLMALVNVVLFFAQTFMDFGVNNAIIYKQEIRQRQLSSLYWLSVLVGSVLGLLVLLASYVLADFYDSPELRPLLQAMALSFIITSWGSQYKILLTKALRFDQLARVELLATGLAFVVTIALAWQGYGVWALVMGFLVKALVETLAYLLLGRQIYRPSWVLDFKEISFFIRFGGFQLGEGLLNYFSRQIDVIIIAKVLGYELLGVYDVIKKFLQRPLTFTNPIMTSVLFPVLSKLQDDPQEVARLYLRQVRYLCLLNFPLYLLLIFQAEGIIVLMFGEEWLAYDYLFRLFAGFFLIYSFGNPIGTLLLSQGRPDLGLAWNFLVFIVFTSTIVLVTEYGLEQLAEALFLLQIFFIIPLYLLVIRHLAPIGLGAYLRTLGIPFVLALISNMLAFALCYGLTNPLLQVLGALVCTGLTFLVLVWYWQRDFLEDVRKLIPKS